MWYPQDKEELEKLLLQYLISDKKLNKVNGLVVPHAGYFYSGAIAGRTFALVKEKVEKAIILGPSHSIPLFSAITSKEKYWETPLGKIVLFNENFPTADINQEHSITNQIPFLQKLNIKKIMPLMIGEINAKQAEQIAEKISAINALYVFSTDLSHFLSYEQAVKKDKQTINIIENLDINNFQKIDACGIYPLLILFYLCKIKNTKPKLIIYKNSGDVTGDKTSVVGYASFWF